MKDFKEIDKILEAADLICINCVEDTLSELPHAVKACGFC